MRAVESEELLLNGTFVICATIELIRRVALFWLSNLKLIYKDL